MTAIIYQPAPNPMQSGPGKRRWVLEFLPRAPRTPDSLMGWNSSYDTQEQLRLTFESQEAAIAYAKKHGIAYSLRLPRQRFIQPKSYAENFRFNKLSG